METRAFLRLLLSAFFVLSALIQLPASGAQAPAAPDVPKLAFEKFTLPNGLEVILHQDRRLPIVAVNVWYHVGPANEEPGLTGFAHLFEHLMFAGSKHVPRGSHVSLLEAAGGTFGGTTNLDRTNYYQTLPSNQLELALWLESDRMGYLLDAVDQAALSNQQDVVRNERRQTTENRPYGIVYEKLVQQLYPPGHPYYANVIGSHADIQAARLDNVKQFFRRYYAPNNASIAIAGDIDPAQVRALVVKYFGSLRRGPPVPPIKVETPKLTAERRIVVQDRIELPRVYMAWLTPPLYKPGDAEADIAALVLAGGRSSRLYRKLVYERQIAQDVSAYQASLTLVSNFVIVATARPGHTLEELERAIEEELETLRTAAPDAAEVERARNSFETDFVQGLESVSGVSDRLNHYNHYVGDPGFLPQDVQRYRAVTPAAVLAFAREQLPKSARVVVHAVPGEPDLGPPVPTPEGASAGAAQGAESVNADEPWRKDPPQPGPSRPLRLAAPESARLSNGLRLILSERKDLPIVAANLVFRTGRDANPPDSPGLASFTAAMLDEGTETRGALQIAEELAQLGAGMGAGSGPDSTSVFAQALRKNFGATLELMADTVLRPTFPPEEIERQRVARLTGLAQERNDPAAVAGRIIAAVLYGEQHPYGYPDIGTQASVKAMTRERLMAFWKQNYVPNNAALVVAGDITMKELRALAEKAFGGWAPGEPQQPKLGPPATAQSRVVMVERSGAPQTALRVVSIGAARSTPDYEALEVMNTALGGQFTSRINLNLREARGYTYGASSGFGFRKSPGPFIVSTGVRTDVTGPALEEIFKELRGIAQAPMPADELKRAKDAMSFSLAGVFETNSGTAGIFSSLYAYDLPLDYYTHYGDRVNAVTTEQALAVAKKYLVPERMIVVAVGDRAAVEAQLKSLKLEPIELRDTEGKPLK